MSDTDWRRYNAWYETARGAWIGTTEAHALIELGKVRAGVRLLDVGCGSGWFTRVFARHGYDVVGLDRDLDALSFAQGVTRGGAVYVGGDAHALPFATRAFDTVSAVTSLCFVRDERRALQEMVRVARRCVLLGLLHRDSLWYRRKHGRGAYAGAHWNDEDDVRDLIARAVPQARTIEFDRRLFWPGGRRIGAHLERYAPLRRRGGFLAVAIFVAADTDIA